MNQGPVTVANGVMFAGALDGPGTMYAFNASTGDSLWSFASGGSVNSGAAVVDGVVYWGSGYSSALGATAGTHLYAFSVPVLKKEGLEENSNQPAESPKEFGLDQNYPNPFNPETSIQFTLPEAAFVKLTIYNSAGQLVKSLANGEFSAGKYSINWDATDQNGVKVPSGAYIYRLEADDFVKTNKMILLK